MAVWLFYLADGLIFLGLGLLLAGWIRQGHDRHLWRIAGWLVFGISWVVVTPYYFSVGSTWYGLFTALAFPLFAYIAWHEWRTYGGETEVPALTFVAGATAIGALMFFTMDRIPIISGLAILFVAWNTVLVLRAVGMDYSVGDLDIAGSLWYSSYATSSGGEIILTQVQIEGTFISIIMACTGLQAMILFGVFAFASRADWKRKLTVTIVSVVALHLLNTFRNTSIIYLTNERGWDFDFTHGTLAVIVSLIALIGLVFYALHMLPEVQDDIQDLMALPWRGREPGPPSGPAGTHG